MTHDDAQRPEEGTEPRRRHDADHPTGNTDPAPEEENVGGGDNPVGDAESSVAKQQVAQELDEAEEILEGEIEESIDDEILDGEIVEPRLRRKLISESWKAPLPPPAALREYEDICPGAADRVLRMAERQIDLRDKRESILQIAVEGEVHVQTTLAEGDRDALKRGQYLAAGVSIIVAGLSVAGMFLTPWAALGFAVPLAQVATSLIRTISDGHGQEPPAAEHDSVRDGKGDPDETEG